MERDSRPSSDSGSDEALHNSFEDMQLLERVGDQAFRLPDLSDQPLNPYPYPHTSEQPQVIPQPPARHSHTSNFGLPKDSLHSSIQLGEHSNTHEAPMVSSQTDNSCSGKCGGDLIGPHKCQRLHRSPRITCLSSNCTQVFTTKGGFNRHFRYRHGATRQLLGCTVAGCMRVGDRGFSRRDNMLQHLRDVHGQEVQRVRFGVIRCE